MLKHYRSYLILFLCGSASAQLPDRLLLADTPETLLRLSLAEVDQFAEEASWLAVDSVAFLMLSLHGSRGDMPDEFPEVSPFNTPHLPSSGLNAAKIEVMRQKVEAIRRRGLIPHVKVHEEEHADESVFNFSIQPTSNPTIIGYWQVVDTILGPGTAIVDFEECQLPATWVSGYIAWWSARPDRIVAIHNHPSFEAGLFDPQVGNLNLGILMLQISDTNIAHNKVTLWRNKIAQAGGAAVVMALEPGPSMIGIPPDANQSTYDHARLLRQWGSELFDAGAAGVGMYCGYSFDGSSDSDSASLLSHTVWFRDLSIISGTRRRSIERYILGQHSIEDGLDLNADGAVDIADLLIAAAMEW
jgi:hypothetical protein